MPVLDASFWPPGFYSVMPPVKKIYYEGNRQLLEKPAVAIVGSRTPSSYGREQTVRLVEKLVERGIVIISGFARGIDFTAHETALAAGGETVAVLGCGLSVDYPNGRSEIRARMKDRALLLTEFADDVRPAPFHFPLRNRLLPALSRAVIVIECSRASGTMSTAFHALEQAVDLYALPGDIDRPMCAGPNYLISLGAYPLIDIRQVILNI